VIGQVTGDCGGTCPPAGQGGAYLGAFSVTDGSPMATWSGALPGEVVSSVPTPGPGPASGRLHALYWTCDIACGEQSTPTGFGYARSDAVSVTAGEVRQVALPRLVPAPIASLPVDLVRPAGLTTDRTLILLNQRGRTSRGSLLRSSHGCQHSRLRSSRSPPPAVPQGGDGGDGSAGW